MSDPILPFDLTSLTTVAREISYQADEAGCARIAERLDLVGISQFSLEGRLERQGKKGAVLFDGRVTAHVTQRCVVTLEPIEAEAVAEFSVVLIPAGSDWTRREVEVDPEDDDIEYVAGDHADLGDLAVQQLALSLDPYPRRTGLADVAKEVGLDLGDDVGLEAQESARPSPFEVLRQLKDKA